MKVKDFLGLAVSFWKAKALHRVLNRQFGRHPHRGADTLVAALIGG